MREPWHCRDIAFPRIGLRDGFDTMIQIRALLAFEVEMEEGVILAGPDFHFLQGCGLAAKEVLYQLDVAREREWILLNLAARSIIVVLQPPDICSLVDAAAKAQLIQHSFEHESVKRDLHLMEWRCHMRGLDICQLKDRNPIIQRDADQIREPIDDPDITALDPKCLL